MDSEHSESMIFDLRDLALNIISQISLRNPARKIPILLEPQHRPKESHTQDAEERRNQMPNEHKPMSDVRQNKLDKLGRLIEIFLLGDVIQCLVTIGRGVASRGVGGEIQDSRQSRWCNMERHNPDREDLRHVHVELEMLFIEGCAKH